MCKKPMVTTFDLDEETLQAFRRYLVCDDFPVQARARLLNALFIQICSEYLHLEAGGLIAEKLQQGHSEGISLLAGRAARRPHSDGAFVTLVLHNGGIDLGLQGLESLEIAEKAGHRDEDVVVELWSLFGMLLQIPGIFTKGVQFQDHCAPQRTPVNGIGLVLME